MGSFVQPLCADHGDGRNREPGEVTLKARGELAVATSFHDRCPKDPRNLDSGADTRARPLAAEADPRRIDVTAGRPPLIAAVTGARVAARPPSLDHASMPRLGLERWR